ncbi:MAG: sulfurtransferase [Pseudomonadota bacterium]
MGKFKSVIAASDLAAELGAHDLVVLDCRFDLGDPAAGRKAWEAGHIPGAVYADLDRDLAAPVTAESGRHPLPAPDRMVRRFADWGIGSDTRVAVYDDVSGAIAARAWWLLRWLGHDRVAVLDGGLNAWREAGLPLDDVTPAPVKARLVAEPRDEWVLGTDTLAAGEFPRARLLDARDAARFRGEQEPIDPVAGHVPGAGNLPFRETLAGDGRLKSPAALRLAFAMHLEGDLESPWAVMCGSGVTACHLALAAEHAHLRPPAVYIGSFSEWIRDSGRPVGAAPGERIPGSE